MGRNVGAWHALPLHFCPYTIASQKKISYLYQKKWNMVQQNKALTNLQLELLKIYSFNISDEQLSEIRGILTEYFADKATAEMDRLWDENGWTNDTMDEWLKGENDDTIES